MLIEYTRDFSAPIEKGEVMGTMTYYPTDGGSPVVYDLIAGRTIQRRDNAPLTLEEIFIYELGGADYAVKDIVL